MDERWARALRAKGINVGEGSQHGSSDKTGTGKSLLRGCFEMNGLGMGPANGLLQLQGADCVLSGGLSPFQGADIQIDGGQKRRNDVGMRLLLCFVRRMTSPLKRK